MKYIFWEQYDCKKISGLPKLILMGVKALSIYNNVALISAPTSLVYELLKKDNVNFQFIPEDSLYNNADISSEDILILPNFRKKDLILHKYNPKVIFWQIYPSACVTTKLQKFIVGLQMREVIKHNAFVSMDAGSIDSISKEMGFPFPKNVIPMPIDHLDYCYCPKNLEDKNSIIKISYLGRAVPWKAYAVIKLLPDIERNQERHFELHIITDSADLFAGLIKKYIPGNANVIFYEGKFGDDMLNIMRQMDIHLAMGISTLEGAAMGIPTLSAPYNHEMIPDYYKFHWFYEDLENYSGSPITKEYVNKIGHSFEDILSSISSLNSLKNISEKCFQGASLFSLEAIAKQIEQVPTTLHLRKIHYLMGSFWKSKIRNINPLK